MAVLLPAVVTVWLLVEGFGVIHDKISVHIKNGLEQVILFLGGSAAELDKLWIDAALSVAGFLLALISVCIVGAILASVVGKSLWHLVEKFIMNTPFLKQVYPYVKQITDFLFTQKDKKTMFSSVVAIEYPRKGIWSMGLVTGSGLKKIVDKVEKEFLTVLIPTSPTPFTGFVIMVEKEQTIKLDLTIEEALRFTVSAGVVTPEASEPGTVLPKTGLENDIGQNSV